VSRAGLWSPLLLTVAAACGRDVTFVDPRAATEPGDTTNGNGGQQTVVRGNLDVTVTIAPEDSAIAQALGFPGLALVGATVTARRLGQPLQEAITDSAGRVTFEALVTGAWPISAVRVLTAEERAALPAGAEDVAGFAGGGTAQVAESGSSFTVPVVLGRQGGVVIGEVFAPVYQVPSLFYYYTGGYLELYNNGFETIYLDQMVVGMLEYPADNVRETCEQVAVHLEDPLGLWVRYFYRFPGSGREYPLAPSTSAVVATDAIDHRAFVSGLQDLSGASFEFLGSADVDNPAVPNMVDIGFLEYRAAVGHGLTIGQTVINVFLSAPVDPDTLPQYVSVFGHRFARIPRGAVLDVFTSWPTPEVQAAFPFLEWCPRMVNEVFDRESAYLYDSGPFLSLRRRVLQVLRDGRIVLQRTGSSAADLELAAPTPGSVP